MIIAKSSPKRYDLYAELYVGLCSLVLVIIMVGNRLVQQMLT